MRRIRYTSGGGKGFGPRVRSAFVVERIAPDNQVSARSGRHILSIVSTTLSRNSP
jgi:hypothetical protein